jgi:HD-GYP domain-containing protein (c-di-GMP phosphodiesterase class II)
VDHRTERPILLLTAPGEIPEVLGDAARSLRRREIESLTEVDESCLPAVLLLTDALLQGGGVSALGRLPNSVAILSSGPAARVVAKSAGGHFFFPLEDVPDADVAERLLRSALGYAAATRGIQESRSELNQVQTELQELNKIGMALMSERNQDRLLNLILTQARTLTTSDAGSLYLVEEGEGGEQHLHFRLAQNDTLPDLPVPDFTLPLDETSVAGYAASTGEPLVIEDVYELPAEMPFSFNKADFDEKFGYRAKSQLVVPMKDHKGKVVGVLQLINRKSDPSAEIRDDESSSKFVLPYRDREVATLLSLAGQAAVSIENGQLYQEIENLFDGFIKAAVIAVDQRDPTTSGHSVRVTALTCDLAEAAHKTTEGPFKDVSFTPEDMKQLRYAGLLHDFGKIGVREEVLVKMNKLPPVMEARIESRFDYILKALETDFHQKKTAYLLEHGSEGFEGFVQQVDSEFNEAVERVGQYREAVREANTPRVLAEEGAEVLQEIGTITYLDPEGNEAPYLTEEELHYLSIKRGSLDPEERKQIESHVVHSYNYLLEIPWTEELSRIAEIAKGHHEKMNGKGYPDGVSAEGIPVETRIMAVCDIFDALTASDRPYKKAMPVEKALSILKMEADEGGLDPDCVELFIESEVYRKVLDTDWRDL